MEVMRRHLVVAALEFGTSNSGYAFSWIHEFDKDPLNIHLNELWRTGSHICISTKTSTCLLLNNEKQFVAFGYDAENRYAELVMVKEHANYYFFDRFTTSLHSNENVTRDMVLKDKTGKQCSAVEVFTLSIKAFVDRLMKELEGGVELFRDEILWVLIVPAAWTDSAKQLMKESAVKAGLHAEKALLITEPEAAITFCHYLPTERLQGSKDKNMITDPGTKSMVVNLGDMTADITVLQQNYNGQLKELFKVTGDDCGGASVDDRFCKMLEEIFGRNVITELKRQYPSCWLYLLQQFKIKIDRFKTSNTKVITFVCPLSLNEICEYLHGKDLQSVIKSSSHVNETTGRDNKLRFKADLMIKFVTPTIDSIITLMKNTLSNKSMNGVSNILMVGELSECPMIREAVQKAFPGKGMRIPDKPGLSVLYGAVLFGHRPDYIRSVKGDSLDDDDDDDDGCIGK